MMMFGIRVGGGEGGGARSLSKMWLKCSLWYV